jgi:chemotaxis protein methyltransferase CheR
MTMDSQIEEFHRIITQRLGLQFDERQLPLLEEVLNRRLQTSQLPEAQYLHRLGTETWQSEIAALAGELTVAETYFLRNSDQFAAFAETVLPDCLERQARSRRIRILSAGCASGEEPYSLSITLKERMPDSSWDFSILGIDINPKNLQKARRARFSSWALRETPPDIQRRWFRSEGRDAVLDESVKRLVTFQEKNLTEDDPQVWGPGSYDVIFCRNVLMYFSPERASSVVSRIARALTPSGYLFLGHAETLRGLSDDFHLCHTHGTFYYQRKEDGVERVREARLSSVPLTATEPAPPVTAAPVVSDDWIATIQHSAERIRLLTMASEDPAANLGEPNIRAWDLTLALELLRKEEFAGALDLLRTFPTASVRDPDVLLLRAVLLTHSGKLSDAEECCQLLLGMNEMNPGARYLLALCREGARDYDGAIDHDQAAAYLDPSFSMPRLHLGLMARRAGHRENARKELRHALRLLSQEDASRLLLFGGGFSRGALQALCQSELLACGVVA